MNSGPLLLINYIAPQSPPISVRRSLRWQLGRPFWRERPNHSLGGVLKYHLPCVLRARYCPRAQPKLLRVPGRLVIWDVARN